MVINPIKTKSMTITTKQKHQLSPLLLNLVLHGAKIYQVSEHCLLGITIDNKLFWDSHTNNACKTVSRRFFLLSKLRYISLDLVLNGAKTDQVSEHRLLGITIDSKLRWDSHINNVCKTVSRRVFILSKLRYIVDIDTRKLFFNAHIKLHIDYASVLWNGCMMFSKRD